MITHAIIEIGNDNVPISIDKIYRMPSGNKIPIYTLCPLGEILKHYPQYYRINEIKIGYVTFSDEVDYLNLKTKKQLKKIT